MAEQSVDLGSVIGATGANGADGADGRDGQDGKGYETRGEWTPNTNYVNSNTTCDIVTYQGSSYYCKRSNARSVAPDIDTDYWGVFAVGGGVEKGEGGSLTLATSDWVSASPIYCLKPITGLNAKDAIFVRGISEADDALVSVNSVFAEPTSVYDSGTGKYCVRFTAKSAPSSNISLSYFIVRGQ